MSSNLGINIPANINKDMYMQKKGKDKHSKSTLIFTYLIKMA